MSDVPQSVEELLEEIAALKRNVLGLHGQLGKAAYVVRDGAVLVLPEGTQIGYLTVLSGGIVTNYCTPTHRSVTPCPTR